MYKSSSVFSLSLSFPKSLKILGIRLSGDIAGACVEGIVLPVCYFLASYAIFQGKGHSETNR